MDSNNSIIANEVLKNRIIQIKRGPLIFSLNLEKQTASVIQNDFASKEVLIPQTVEYNHQEFYITKISRMSFERAKAIKSIQFSINSKIQTIESKSFIASSIEKITIPPSVTQLNEGWCRGTPNLKTVIIMKGNERYRNCSNVFVIGKSDTNKDEYDNLLFANRTINTATIPSYIKRISPSAFEHCLIENITIPSNVIEIGEGSFFNCEMLHTIEIPEDSELQIIGEYAFADSSFDSIFIPSHVKKIYMRAFYCCNNLYQIEIPENSELEIIESDAFLATSIDSLLIPSNVSMLCKRWCKETPDLIDIKVMKNNKFLREFDGQFIVGKTDQNSNDFDSFLFIRRDIISLEKGHDTPQNIIVLIQLN